MNRQLFIGLGLLGSIVTGLVPLLYFICGFAFAELWNFSAKYIYNWIQKRRINFKENEKGKPKSIFRSSS